MKLLHPDSTWIVEHKVADDELVVATTRDELALLVAASIGEALEAVEGWEFDTRLGSTPDDARALRDRIWQALRG